MFLDYCFFFGFIGIIGFIFLDLTGSLGLLRLLGSLGLFELFGINRPIGIFMHSEIIALFWIDWVYWM